MRSLAVTAILIALSGSAQAQATPDTVQQAPALAGCWTMRDTKAEIARHAEDPFYFSSASFCFDEGGPGQLVTRAAEFSGFRNESGDWVNGGGDGWEEPSSYEIAGEQMRITDAVSVQVCRFALDADALTLADCVIEDVPDNPKIEDTYYDRAPN
jgi:hypothetical protein